MELKMEQAGYPSHMGSFVTDQNLHRFAANCSLRVTRIWVCRSFEGALLVPYHGAENSQRMAQ